MVVENIPLQYYCVHTHMQSELYHYYENDKRVGRFYGFLDLNKLFVRQTTLIFKINYILVKKLKTLIQVYKSVIHLLFTKVIMTILQMNFHKSTAIGSFT